VVYGVCVCPRVGVCVEAAADMNPYTWSSGACGSLGKVPRLAGCSRLQARYRIRKAARAGAVSSNSHPTCVQNQSSYLASLTLDTQHLQHHK